MTEEEIRTVLPSGNSIPPRGRRIHVPADWAAGLLYFLDLFVKIRWGAVTSVSLVILTCQFFIDLNLPYRYLYLIAGAIFAYNAFFYFVMRKQKRQPKWPYLSSKRCKKNAEYIALAQVNLDFLSLFSLLALSGGLNNPFILMFFFHVVIAAILLDAKWAIVETVIASVMVFILAIMEHWIGGCCVVAMPAFSDGFLLEGWLLWLGKPMVMIVTLFLLNALTLVIVLEYARRRRQVVSLSIDLEKKNEQLSHIDEMRRGLLSVASHDLKAPMNAVATHLQVIKGGYAGEITEKQSEILQKCLNRLDDLNKFTSEVLSLQAVNRGELEQNLRRIDPVSVITQATEDLSGIADDKGITVILSDMSSVPHIDADPRRLLQLFENIISNGIKYTSPGGKVIISGSTKDNMVQFKFADTGIGISEADLKHIFSEFYRSRNVRAKYDGTGLGLAIVAKIVKAHGGNVFAKSTEGEGTTIFVELPILRMSH